MLRNNSRDLLSRGNDNHHSLAHKFESVINFIDWSQK